MRALMQLREGTGEEVFFILENEVKLKVLGSLL